jgi:hypothetical protein
MKMLARSALQNAVLHDDTLTLGYINQKLKGLSKAASFQRR